MHTKILLLLFATLLPSSILAQYQELWISNPDNSWDRTAINVHETVFEVHPKGTFAEVELFISFSSANPSNFHNSELLEMVSTFELDENITVSDLWLWFDEQILVAHIIDRWTANRVYEGIVNRQQDPAILYKNSPTSYELRIYPFTREQVRKIKISFLIPTQQQNASQAIPLPTKFNQLAQNNLENAVIRYFTEEEDPELSLSEYEDISFTSATDSLSRTYWEAEVNNSRIAGPLNLEIPAIGEESTSLIHYADSTGKYYSLSFVPTEVLDVGTTKKVVIIFDHAASNSNSGKEELLQRIQQNIKANFSDKDQFNFLYSTVSNEVMSEDWIPATDAAVDSLFEEVNSADILDVSNLNDLLVTGIDFTKAKGNGNILLISSSDTYYKFADANSFSESILNYAGDDLPQINIVDIQDNNIIWRYRNSRDYRGNEYLYDIFARESGGKLFNFRDHNDTENLIHLGHQNLDGNISNYTVYTTFSGGFSYGNFDNQTSGKIPINSTFSQTGMYFGDPPVTIQFSGTTQDTVFSEEIVINNTTATDSSLKRFWTGRQIHALESGNPDNEEISAIIDYSIENRLMSQYTSFLSIEPGDTTLINEAQEDIDNPTVSVEDGTPDSFEIESLKAYPNPFNPQVNIEVNLTEPWNASDSRIVIYNILGQKIATLNTASFNGQRSFTVNWDISKNSAELATGVYFVSVETPSINKKIKITYLK